MSIAYSAGRTIGISSTTLQPMTMIVPISDFFGGANFRTSGMACTHCHFLGVFIFRGFPAAAIGAINSLIHKALREITADGGMVTNMDA
jgi:hypothetical protein